MRYAAWLTIIILCNVPKIYAQFNITFPTERAVFQRNNQNQGTIFITGNYQIPISVIQARLTALQGGQSTEWTTIAINPAGGNYAAQITGAGGWYTLEMRGLQNGAIVAETRVDRVGIGEVFLIAGQSNASGVVGDTFHPTSTDDRVSCITNFFDNNTDTPPFPQFGRLRDGNTQYAPQGFGSWMWGVLGDKLASQEQVPILFINTGLGGLAIDAWTDSRQGGQSTNPFSGFKTPAGYPYNYIRYSLNYYVNLLGIRSILWVQGESDNLIRKDPRQYQRELEDLIRTTRENSSKNIPWVIARVSRLNGETYTPVINAQTAVATTYPNTFLGPDLDQITDRYDRTHFNTLGLLKAADAWMDYLTPNFFNVTSTSLGIGFVQPTLFCTTDSPTPMRISLPGNFQRIRWNTGQTASEIFTTSGNYQAEISDATGNVRYSPNLFFGNDLIPPRPTILIDGGQSICDGEVTTLRSNVTSGIIWNTGQTTPNITIRQTTTAQVTAINTYGCINRSNPVTIRVNPVPRPEIRVDGNVTICSDQSTNLVSNLTSGIQWSTGSQNPLLTVQQTGSYTLTATNEFGCTNTTEPVSIFVGAKPAIPVVDRISLFTLQIANPIPGNQGIEWSLGGQLVPNQNAPTLRMTQPGNYAVRGTATYQALGRTLTCESNFSPEINLSQDDFEKQVIIFPNPVITSSFKTELREIEEDVTVQIYTTLGQLVRSFEIARFDEVKTFPVNGIPKGTYFVEIKNRYLHVTKRILID